MKYFSSLLLLKTTILLKSQAWWINVDTVKFSFDEVPFTHICISIGVILSFLTLLKILKSKIPAHLWFCRFKIFRVCFFLWAQNQSASVRLSYSLFFHPLYLASCTKDIAALKIFDSTWYQAKKKPQTDASREKPFPPLTPQLTGLCAFTFLCSNPWLCTE